MNSLKIMDFIVKKIEDFISKYIKQIFVAGVAALVGLFVSERRSRHKELKKIVKMTALEPVDKETAMADGQILIIPNDEDLDLTQFKEVPIRQSESNKWKDVFSSIVGETAKTGTTSYAMHGLLKCDVPVKELCKVKGNPIAMRGFIQGEKGIGKHASFTEAGVVDMAPLMVFQLSAFVTSQYYQHLITERLTSIESKLNKILIYFDAKDRSILEVNYDLLIDLNNKTTYDLEDKRFAKDYLREILVIRDSYKKMLSNINSPDISFSLSNKSEAESKIKALYDSKFFVYLEIALQAEYLVFIASAICMRIADKLENEEDLESYAGKMNPYFWNEYANKYEEIKHDVLKTLEFEADTSSFHEKSIRALKDDVEKRFNEVEDTRQDLQKIYAQKITQYIKIQEDGLVKKFIHAC